MKIFLSFLQDLGNNPPHNIPAYRFWSYYIKNGIQEAGMQWTEAPLVDWAAGLALKSEALEQWKAFTWEKTLNFIKANRQHVDIFLSYLYPSQISTGAINEIKKLGIPCVNFYCDNIRDFEVLPKEFSVFDLLWVPEVEALTMYKTARLNHIHLPMPMWVDPVYRSLKYQERDRISFIGSKDSLREELLYKVISKGLPVEVRGAGWLPSTYAATFSKARRSVLINTINFIKSHGIKGLFIKILQQLSQKEYSISMNNIFEKPDFDNYILLTKESKVTLGINRVPTFKRLNNNPLTYSRLRDIEAPMLGACYITEYTKDLDSLYDLGNEIETYRSAEELIDKCTYLSGSNYKRDMLRFKGQKRALSTHSIPNSLLSIKQKLYH